MQCSRQPCPAALQAGCTKGSTLKKQFAALAAGLAMSTFAQADGGWHIYLGADVMQTEVSVSRSVPPAEEGQLGSKQRLDADADGVRVRGGLWLSEDFAVEVQLGVSSDSAEAPETGEIDSYYGVFITPRAQPFEWLDMTFPMGLAAVDTIIPGDPGEFIETSSDGVAFGVNLQLRLGEIISNPDSFIAGFGIGAGFMVYNTSGDNNVRGYNGGLHFGFDF